jgi:hypothetical protein
MFCICTGDTAKIAGGGGECNTPVLSPQNNNVFCLFDERLEFLDN